MPETPVDNEQRTNKQDQESSTQAKGRRKPWRLGLAFLTLVIVVALFLLYGWNYLPTTIRSALRSGSDTGLGPLFGRVSADRLLSSDVVLQAVGRGPMDPSKLMATGLERSNAALVDEKTDASAPAGDRVITQSDQTPQAKPDENSHATVDAARDSSPPSSGQPPSVEVREPPLARTREPKTESGAPDDTSPLDSRMEKDTSKPSRPVPIVGRFEDRQEPEKKSLKTRQGDTTPIPGPTAAIDQGKPDQFQLPGSLVVQIHNYTGTTPKWGLMVILDDSASMGRKLKTWSPNRMNSAVGVVEKLPEILGAGSRVSVRDFMCKKVAEHASAKNNPCLSHMLYEWTDFPFKGLKAKLAQIDPGGSTNPCAAAAYSLKRDFSVHSGLSPRLLIVTDGSGRCAFKEPLAAVEKQMGKDKISVDVLALGMHRKRQAGYSKLANRTNGLFLRLDRPTDVQAALTKYSKLLKTSIKEKVEIRGEKAVMSVNPDEEIALVPGTYSVVLPAVAGISPSKRTIESVQIRSGEATALQVKVKKGKPMVKIEKK